MPPGSTLSNEERGKILAYKESGMSISLISKKLHRSRCVIRNFIQSPSSYHIIKRTGRKHKLSDRDQRLLLNKSSNSSLSCAKLASIMANKVSKTTIWRTLNRCKHLKSSKLIKAPCLLPRHKIARLQFAKEHLSVDWDSVSKICRFGKLFVSKFCLQR